MRENEGLKLAKLEGLLASETQTNERVIRRKELLSRSIDLQRSKVGVLEEAIGTIRARRHLHDLNGALVELGLAQSQSEIDDGETRLKGALGRLNEIRRKFPATALTVEGRETQEALSRAEAETDQLMERVRDRRVLLEVGDVLGTFGGEADLPEWLRPMGELSLTFAKDLLPEMEGFDREMVRINTELRLLDSISADRK